MDNVKYCHPCAPVLLSKVTTETPAPKAPTPTSITINFDWILGLTCIVILYKLLNSLRRPKPRISKGGGGVSMFIENASEKYRDEVGHQQGRLCAPPTIGMRRIG